MDVLPVWRSPMISSRWPRPMGIIESMARMPVCIGSSTGWRWMTPGALNSTGRMPSALMGPLPSIGMPSGFTTRPSISLPEGISTIRPVVFTVDGLAVGTHELEELARHGVLEAVDARDTVADLDDGSDFARFDARIERIELLAQCLVNRLCGDFSH